MKNAILIFFEPQLIILIINNTNFRGTKIQSVRYADKINIHTHPNVYFRLPFFLMQTSIFNALTFRRLLSFTLYDPKTSEFTDLSETLHVANVRANNLLSSATLRSKCFSLLGPQNWGSK